MSFKRFLMVAAAVASSAACSDSTNTASVARVTVTPAEHTIVEGKTATLSVQAVDDAGTPVVGRQATWSSSDASVASVTPAGVVRAVSTGTAVIRAAVDGRYGEAGLTVVKAPVARVDVTPATASMSVGESVVLSARAFDADGIELPGRAAAWESFNGAIVAVDASGRLRALSPGTATIRVTIDGRMAEVTVTVLPVRVASIAVSPTAVVMNVGAVRQLTAFVFDAAGNRLADRVVTWTSDSPQVALVDAAGLVSATGPGYATIVALCEGRTFGVAFTVSNGESDPMAYDLVYHRTRPGALGEIMILGTGEGSAPVKLNAGNVSRQPSASPDGNRIAFYVSQRELDGAQTDDIFAVDRNGMNMRRLTSEAGYDGDPAWSPRGDRIAYRRIDPLTGRADIWAMNADGSQKVNLTGDLPTGESAGAPAWSPDGARLAFATARSGQATFSSAIWVMAADGSGKRQVVVSSAAGDRSPAWSPDGSKLAFIRPFGDETDIVTVAVTGGEVTRVRLAGRQEGPAWSPDGRHIAYWQYDVFGGTGIYTVRADGTNARLHTVDPSWGGGYDPEWIRRPAS